MNRRRRRILLVVVLALLSVAGLIALAHMASEGAEPRWGWGYIAAVLSFLLSACQLAPVLSMSSRVGRGYWGAPLRRIADLLGLAGIITAPLLLLLLTNLPDWRGRPSIWFDWPGAPGVYDAAASVGLALCGAALVAVATWPEHRRRGWAATPTQWRVLTRTLIALGALYTMLAVFAHLSITGDLAISLVPGWHSAVMPPYHIASGFEAAVALVVVGLTTTNVPGHHVTRTAAKLLLALALLWFYFAWCELLTNWYGRTPDEQSLLSLFMFGPGFGLFIVSALCNCFIPVGALLWYSARGSRTAVTCIAAIILFGTLVDRVRLFVGAWSVATQVPADHLPDQLSPLPLPGPLEIVACVGILAFAGLLATAVLSRVSAVSHWEVKAVARLTPERTVLRTRTTVIARPG